MMDVPSDAQLLEAFARTRAEASFVALVRRHLDLVHSAACRLTRDAHLAEDVSQEVFVVLARDAGRLAPRVASGMPLSAWLHATTRNVASKLVRTSVRRRVREYASATMAEHASTDAGSTDSWDEVAPHLDAGLSAMSESDRSLILLRYFDRLSARQVGTRLGISEEAAQKRVRRALERLQRLLQGKMPDLSVSTLSTLLGVHAIQSAPQEFAASLPALCLKAVAGLSPAPLAAGLTQFFMTKTQALLTGALITAVSLPLGYQQWEWQRLRSDSARPPSAVVTSAKIEASAPDPKPPDESAELARLRQRRDELQARIAARAKRQGPTLAPGPATRIGPVLLEKGRAVPLTNLVLAGNATPEAAAQSILARMRDDAVEDLVDSFLLSPSDRAEYYELQGQPGGRAQISELLRSSVTNVVAVELRDVRTIDERRREVVLGHLSAGETNEHRLTFGNAGSGWKLIP